MGRRRREFEQRITKHWPKSLRDQFDECMDKLEHPNRYQSRFRFGEAYSNPQLKSNDCYTAFLSHLQGITIEEFYEYINSLQNQ